MHWHTYRDKYTNRKTGKHTKTNIQSYQHTTRENYTYKATSIHTEKQKLKTMENKRKVKNTTIDDLSPSQKQTQFQNLSGTDNILCLTFT